MERILSVAARSSSFLSGVLTTALVMAAQPAQARIKIEPHIGFRQVFSDNVAASATDKDAGLIEVIEPGVTATLTGGKTKASLDYRLEYREPVFAQGFNDKVRHNLAARFESELVDRYLTLEGGSTITQVFRDFQGATTLNPDTLTGNLDNVALVYVQPRLRGRINEYAGFEAGWLYSITRVQDRPDNRLLFNDFSSPFGGQNFQSVPSSDANNQNAYALLHSGDYFQHVRWTLSGTYETEKRRFLNEFYTSQSVIAGLEIPINRAISILGSAGWERSRDIEDVISVNCDGTPNLIDPVTGLPTTDTVNGVLLIDRSDDARNGRLAPLNCGTGQVPVSRSGLLFTRDGFIWDVGLRLSPTRRTNLEIRGGGRFSATNINAIGTHKFSDRSTVQVVYSTSLNSFARQLGSGVSGLSPQFGINGSAQSLFLQSGFDPLTNRIFSGNLGINSSTFLARTLQVQYGYRLPTWNFATSAVYERRRLQSAPSILPRASTDVFSLPEDRSVSGSFVAEHKLSPLRSVFAQGVATRSEFALNGNRTDYLYGGSTGYRVNFTPKIRGEARYLFSRRTSSVPGFNITENAVTLGIEARF